MRISADYTVEDWKGLAFASETDWALAVDMFRDRLKSRHLDHIDVLLTRKTSGFAVLSLDCTLVETLQQYRLGSRKTPRGKGKEYFVEFLTATAFSQHFQKDSAEIFYTEIRCGLLHQAEAEGSSRIKRGERPLVEYTADHKSVVINVHRFHALLKEVISSYEQELLRPGSVSAPPGVQKEDEFHLPD